MGAAVGKQFQTKSAEQRAKRSSIVVSALQSYQKEFPNERIGVENGHYDPKIFRQAVLLGIKERRIDASVRDMTEEDMEEVGQLYFNSIPKYVNDTNPQTTNVVELLVEDVGDNVIYETRESRAEEKGGKYNNRNHDEKSINLRFQHSAANLSIGDGEDGDIGNSPATRHTPTLRSRSFFSDNTSSSSSSILPILSSSSAVDGDYCAVNHRVSLKSTFQTGDDNDESFLSGLKFMSADDKKIKSKNRDSFKNSYDDDHLPIHLQDFDRPNGSSLPGDKWEGYTKEVPGKFLSSPTGISPTSPANYRVAKNIVGDDMSHGNNIGDVKGDSGKLFPYKSKNATTATAPTQDINDGIRREFRRKVHTMNRMGSDNEIVSRNDSGGEDDKGSGGNSQYFRPALDSISSKNLKKPSSSVGAIRKKSLIPMNLASVVNGRIHLQRTESLESHTNQPTHGSFQPDEASQESQKGTLPPGYRGMKHGEGVMGLQLQRIMSSAQNAQLQKEVDALQKQLAQLEELEGEMEISSRHTGLAAASVNHVTALGAMPYKKSDLSRLSSGPQNTDSYVGATGNLSPRSAVGKIYTSDSPNTYGGGISPNDYGMGLTEVTRGGKNQIHPHRSDSNGIDRGNSGAGSSSSSSSSRMMEEWRDRDLEMNGRSNMIARGNGEGQREKSRESRETSLEREKTVIKERAGENRSSYHREQEREWEQEEIREERKERDRRERRREKEEADDFQSPRYALHTPPRRSGSLTGSASKISSITKSALSRRRLMISERGGGVEEEEHTPKLKELGKERERDRNMEREKEKDTHQPNRAKRISVATTSFSDPTAASSSSAADAYMPFNSAHAEDVRYHVRSPRGSKRSTGVSGGGNSGVGERRNTPAADNGNSNIYSRVGNGAGAGAGKKSHEPKGQNTPSGGTLKVQDRDGSPIPLGTKSPRSRGQRTNPNHRSFNIIGSHSHSNNNSNNNSDTNSTPGANEHNHFFHDAVGMKLLDSNECSEDEFETISDKRKAAVKEAEARRDREGRVRPGSGKLTSRNEGDANEVVQNRNKVNAQKLYEKRISREERSKLHRSQVATVGVDESDGESRVKEHRDADMDIGDQNGVHSNYQYGNASFSIPANGSHGTCHSSFSSSPSGQNNSNINHNNGAYVVSVGSGGNLQMNSVSHPNFNLHMMGPHSRLVSRRNSMEVDNEYSASEHSDNGGEEEKDRGAARSRKNHTQSQTRSQGKNKLTARRRFPYGNERSGNSENEREREKEKEEVSGKEYQSSVLSGEKRRNQIHGSSCNNMVGTRGNGGSIHGKGVSKNISPSNGLGEESYTDHDYPVTASHPYNNPTEHEVSDSDSAMPPNSGLSSKVKFRKSKRRMSFPRQLSGNSFVAKEQSTNCHIDNSVMSARRTGADAASSNQGVVVMWTDDLDSRWGEVDFLLRKRIESEEDIGYTTTAAEAGMLFIDQLNSLAKSLGILRGTLSRWLLPYDNNTRIDEQCSTPHSVVDNMPEIVRGKISERQVHYLVAGANGVRRLVRIKIADDNDLEQARVALLTTINFFKKLQVEAAKHNITNFELFGYRT